MVRASGGKRRVSAREMMERGGGDAHSWGTIQADAYPDIDVAGFERMVANGFPFGVRCSGTGENTRYSWVRLTEDEAEDFMDGVRYWRE